MPNGKSNAAPLLRDARQCRAIIHFSCVAAYKQAIRSVLFSVNFVSEKVVFLGIEDLVQPTVYTVTLPILEARHAGPVVATCQ